MPDSSASFLRADYFQFPRMVPYAHGSIICGQANGMTRKKLEDIKCEQDVIDALEGYSDFEKAVYAETYRIPYGKVSTYQRVAKAIGRPKACRAVANTLHNNPLYPAVPCWRVVKSDGGFGGELKAAAGRRQHVVEEGVPVRDGKVVISRQILH